MRRSAVPALAVALLAGCNEYELSTWEQVDVYHQNPAEAVDILMVVDDSCSMLPYQIQVSSNFEQFITYFIEANVDYQIGVITTDTISPGAGELIGDIITPETPDAADAFTDAVTVGTQGSGFEMGLEAARMALSEPLVSTVNDGFLRSDASLSLIFVSDEEDFSPAPVNDYINGFFEVKGQRSRDVFNASALTVTDLAACNEQQAAQSTPGTRYVDVASQTRGISGNLCADDFASIVLDLSLNTSRLRDTFELSMLPDAASLTVHVEDRELPCEDGAWRYDRVDIDGESRPVVVFDRLSLPAPSEQVTLRYDGGDGDPAAFCGGVEAE